MTTTFSDRLQEAFDEHPVARTLACVMSLPTGSTSAGYPYLQREAWELFRDRVPHLLGSGVETLRTAQQIAERARALGDADEVANVERAAKVVEQIVFTATITAPPDLWLMRHVLGAFAQLGLLERLERGDALYPASCTVNGARLVEHELHTDLLFLLSRGIVEQYDDSFRIAGHPRVRDIAREMTPVPSGVPAGLARLWRRFFEGDPLTDDERAVLLALADLPTSSVDAHHNHWLPTCAQIEIGYRLLPVVLGLRAADHNIFIVDAGGASPREVSPGFDDGFGDPRPEDVEIAAVALRILDAAGWTELDDRGVHWATEIGSRGLLRGPGPFGIIEAYNPYMDRGAQLLQGSGGEVWVHRSENVGASQDANYKTFKQANDALDQFCVDTGFEYRVFVEHAIGRGEATRQRFRRSGDTDIRYFGADLEDPAIDAALAQRDEGILPQNMVFVRNADIGVPSVLLDAIEAEGLDARGAVMFVGNGFHEIRDQTDAKMVEVFREYHDAGMILVFTEENALSVDDLRATAFNTYHAGFKYVHEKSGQGLRPAFAGPEPRLGQKLRAPWSECAAQAGYVRLEKYCSRARTIYPYARPGGHNPSISVGHFVVPRPIAERLGLV